MASPFGYGQGVWGPRSGPCAWVWSVEVWMAIGLDFIIITSTRLQCQLSLVSIPCSWLAIAGLGWKEQPNACLFSLGGHLMECRHSGLPARILRSREVGTLRSSIVLEISLTVPPRSVAPLQRASTRDELEKQDVFINRGPTRGSTEQPSLLNLLSGSPSIHKTVQLRCRTG